MLEFLEWLKQEMEMVDPKKVVKPKGRVKKGEEVVGAMSDELKQIWAVYSASYDAVHSQCTAVDQILHNGKKKRNKAEDAALIEEHHIAHNRHDIVDEIFWEAICEAFPEKLLATKKLIGIRSGFKVVLSPNEDEDHMFGIPIPRALANIISDGIMANTLTPAPGTKSIRKGTARKN